MKKLITSLLIISCSIAVWGTPMRILIIRGGYSLYEWEIISGTSVERLCSAIAGVDNIDIVLFPEFAFAGIDGGTVDERPQVYFDYDSVLGFLPQPWDSTSENDIFAANRIDSLRFIAYYYGCYIWASSCCERIHGTSVSYNSIPIISPDGRIYRIRRKILWSLIETRDTTVHLDTIQTRSGKEVAVMTTICYENGNLDGLLDPVDPPAPLWLLPHGTWLFSMETTTSATQRWADYDTLPRLDSFSESHLWGIVSDGWVRDDAVMLSCDIYRDSWGAFKIDNVHRENVAWEPLAWVIVDDEYVIVDCDVPAVDEMREVYKGPKSAPAPEPDVITAYPKITTGPVFISGIQGNSVNVYNPNGELVTVLQAENSSAIWDGVEMVSQRKFGEYIFDDGFNRDNVELIP